MLNIQPADCRIFTKSLYIDRYLKAGFFKLTLPAVILITRHIVISMVTCHQHEGRKQNFLELCSLYHLNHIFAGRICFNCAYKNLRMSFSLSLIVCCRIEEVAEIFSSMSHKHQSLLLFQFVSVAKSIEHYRNIFFCRHKGLTVNNLAKLFFIRSGKFLHFIIFKTIHHVSRLNQHSLAALCLCIFQSLINRKNLCSVTIKKLLANLRTGIGRCNITVRESLLYFFFHGNNCRLTGFFVRCSKTYQNNRRQCKQCVHF